MMRTESTTAILKRTILALLSQKPMRRKDLYPIIQVIHPDLCNDSLRRSSKGIDYGPAWRAWVGSTLDRLKIEGHVLPPPLKGGEWRMVDKQLDFGENQGRVPPRVGAVRNSAGGEQIDRLAERIGDTETRLDRLEGAMADLKSALLAGNALLQRELTSKLGQEKRPG